MRAASTVLSLAALAPFAHALPSNPKTVTSFPTPADDPFYDVPSNIASYAPGKVIRARTVATTEFGTTINARELFYRTTNRTNDATGTVTTLYIPDTPASPPKILSYQAAEDAVALRCAPSWSNVNASSPQETYLEPTLLSIATFALENGWYFVNSDDEGLGSSWLVGLTEARATLDGVRAAINNLKLGTKKTEVGLVGYSGGAHETVWASSEAATYAPELDIVGAAYGGTPVDLESNYNLLNGQVDAILAGGAIVGLSNGYPDFNATLTSLYTSKGAKVFSELRGVDACLVDAPGNFSYYNFSSTKYFKGGDPMKNPVIAQTLAMESLLSNVSPLKVPVPKFPRYEWHGTADTTVPYEPEIEYIKQQCKKGADITFVSYPGLDHTETFVAGLPDALVFIGQAFSGTLVKPVCGSNTTAAAS